MEFKEVTKKDAEDSLRQELDKLLRTANESEDKLAKIKQDFEGFKKLFARYLATDSQEGIDWSKIQKPPANSVSETSRPAKNRVHDFLLFFQIINYEKLKKPDNEAVKDMLDKLVVVKLNGGLGTSMGCKGPKSVIPVRNDLTFLDLTVQQIENLNKKYGTDVPLVLMNSFNTGEETEKVIKKYAGLNLRILTFEQSRYPRIRRESLMPIAKELGRGHLEDWYPPGHGDFYRSFHGSGQLDALLAEGKEYCFLSNIDNMGATVDLSVLEHMVRQDREFIMEVTEKTRADVKGGTLIQYGGKLRLLEVSQVPKEHLEEFKSVKKFNVFNTNNIW